MTVPSEKHCFTSSVIYNANVATKTDTTGKNYIGLTEGTFKQRYTQHKLSVFGTETIQTAQNHRSISGHSKTTTSINCSILATAPAYSNKSKRCHLCLTEKLYLIRAKKPSLLNKRTELISKCRYENTLYLANFTNRQ